MTISKTSRRAKRLLAAVTRCECHSIHDGFRGVECDAEYAERDLYQFRNAKLRLDSPTKACVRVHSNLWYELTLPEGTI